MLSENCGCMWTIFFRHLSTNSKCSSFWEVQGGPGKLWEAPGGSWGVLGRSREMLGTGSVEKNKALRGPRKTNENHTFLQLWVVPCTAPGASCGGPGASWGNLRASGCDLGALLGQLGAILGILKDLGRARGRTCVPSSAPACAPVSEAPGFPHPNL